MSFIAFGNKFESMNDFRQTFRQKKRAPAQFLVQLVAILKDDNDDYIEWTTDKNGNNILRVHRPTDFAARIIPLYFRHSKYSSFQRQLNYFGFKKIAGKGQSTPCVYVNNETTNDVSSLLRITRRAAVSKEREIRKELGRIRRENGLSESASLTKRQQRLLAKKNASHSCLNTSVESNVPREIQLDKFSNKFGRETYCGLNAADILDETMETAVREAINDPTSFFETSLMHWTNEHDCNESLGEKFATETSIFPCDSSLDNLAMLPVSDDESKNSE